MDTALISNWNSVVPSDGIVFFGGDFVMTANIQYITELVSQLNGTIFFVAGNHDYQNRLDRPVITKLFRQFEDMYQFTVLDSTLKQKHVNFIITHYPFLYWRRGYIHLHGHVHSGPTETNSEKVPYHPMRYDIGVDNNEFAPISYEQLKVKLNLNKELI